MRKSLWLVATLLIAAAAAIGWRFDPPEALEPNEAIEQAPAGSATEPAESLVPPAPAVAPQTQVPPVGEETKPLFVAAFEATLRADADDSLVMGEETLRALEMLSAMSTREREQRLQRLTEQLPSVAASQALDLLPRLTAYRTAVRQLFPPASAPTTVAEARSVLEAVHRLRIDHLGEDAARSFFAQEEKRALRVIEMAGAAADPPRPADEQASHTATLLSMAFSMFIVPRKPPRAIGQQDRDD